MALEEPDDTPLLARDEEFPPQLCFEGSDNVAPLRLSGVGRRLPVRCRNGLSHENARTQANDEGSQNGYLPIGDRGATLPRESLVSLGSLHRTRRGTSKSPRRYKIIRKTVTNVNV
jgi:hypothetical protein